MTTTTPPEPTPPPVAPATPETILSDVCVRLMGSDLMMGRPLSGDRVLQYGHRRFTLSQPTGAATGWFLWTDEAVKSGFEPVAGDRQTTGGDIEAREAAEKWVRHYMAELLIEDDDQEQDQ